MHNKNNKQYYSKNSEYKILERDIQNKKNLEHQYLHTIEDSVNNCLYLHQYVIKKK